MFDLNSRKKNTNIVIQFFKNKLYDIYPDDNVNGYIVLIFHWIIVGIPLFGIFKFQRGVALYLSSLLWLNIFILHLYFNGCIVTKIERSLWNDKEWIGPWLYPFICFEKILNIEITKKWANNIFILWGLFLFTYILFRFCIEE